MITLTLQIPVLDQRATTYGPHSTRTIKLLIHWSEFCAACSWCCYWLTSTCSLILHICITYNITLAPFRSAVSLLLTLTRICFPEGKVIIISPTKIQYRRRKGSILKKVWRKVAVILWSIWGRYSGDFIPVPMWGRGNIKIPMAFWQ